MPATFVTGLIETVAMGNPSAVPPRRCRFAFAAYALAWPTARKLVATEQTVPDSRCYRRHSRPERPNPKHVTISPIKRGDLDTTLPRKNVKCGADPREGSTLNCDDIAEQGGERQEEGDI